MQATAGGKRPHQAAPGSTRQKPTNGCMAAEEQHQSGRLLVNRAARGEAHRHATVGKPENLPQVANMSRSDPTKQEQKRNQ